MLDDPAGPGAERRDVFRLPGFLRFWTAETVSEFGVYVTTIALQVLVVLTLGGAAFEVGLVSAARFLPYLLLGLVVGALIDRRPRKPVLVVTDLGRGLLLGAIPALWALGALTLPALLVIVAAFGVLSVVNDAATQSFVPRLVPRSALLPANARLDQSAAFAQTTGPLAGGGLVGLVGAPFAVLASAATYLASAMLTATIRIHEPPAERGRPLTLGRDIAEGLRWIYHRGPLRPLAISTPIWFVFNAMGGAVLVPLLLVRLGFSPFELGVVVAVAGVFALLGASLSTRAGRGLGLGPVVILCRLAMPVAWGVLLAVALGGVDARWLVLGLVALAQAVIGFAMGLENANEMAFRQAITPDALQGRVNATMRSVNRTMIVVGAPLGGLLADRLGYPAAIITVMTGFALSALVLILSPFRRARHA